MDMGGEERIRDRQRVKRRLRGFRGWQTWQILLIAVLPLPLALTFLRVDNLRMEEKRDAVLAADQAGYEEELKSTLTDLQNFVFSHMNTSTGPFYLASAYTRDAEAVITTAPPADQNIYKLASDYCDPKFNYKWSFAYVECFEAELNKHGADDNLINEELSGIFTFAMRGLERLRKNKFSFTESERSQKALEEFKEQQDATLEFVRGFVEMDESAEPVNVTAFWNYYKEWCGREGYINSQKVSQKNFAQATQRVFREEGIPYKKEKAHGGLLHLFRIRVKGMNDTNADALVGLIDDKDDNGKTKSKKTPSPKPRDEIDEFLS